MQIIERELFKEIKKHFLRKEITFIIGPRQVGKTTLLNLIREYLIKEKKIPQERIFFFNLDRIKDIEFFESQEEVIKFLKTKRDKTYLFIDEAQKIKEAGRFIKGIYDLNLNLKMILSGSSSLELKSKFQESLTGRKQIFYLWPLSFFEFLKYKEPVLFNLINQKGGISQYEKQTIFSLLEDFIIYGGYPNIVKENNLNRKKDLLEEIYNSYIEKDIINFLRIKKPLVLGKLIKLLAYQTGQLVNIDELANSLNVERKTIEHYLDILKETFILKEIYPFFKNPRKELIKTPKIFFWDNGFLNFSLDNFEKFSERPDKGQLLENFVFTELAKNKEFLNKIYYWRTLHQAEVDFVIEKRLKPWPIEVKTTLREIKIPSGLKNFVENYNPLQSWIVNTTIENTIKFNKTKIDFILPFEILKLKKWKL